MKLSKDQKKMIKFLAYGLPAYVIFYIFFRWLFTKEFSWSDILGAGGAAVGSFLVGVLFVIGSRTPEK